MPESPRRLLSLGCRQLSIDLSEIQLDLLIQYIELLAHWNKAFNLTAIREPLAMTSHHLLDSLSVLKYLHGQRILDIGSGAGLPGLPLAIAAEQLRFTLIDSNGKKTRFLKQVVNELHLADRVEIIKMRVEEYRPMRPFDTVISRAFSSLQEFVNASRAAGGPESRLLAMKGRRPDNELDSLDKSVKLLAVIPLFVPGLTAERHLISLQCSSNISC